MKVFGTILGLMLLALIGFNPAPTFADSPGNVLEGSSCVYVREVGHNVHGAFLDFYGLHDGVRHFGAPLTEAFREGSFIVQYFERARLEFHPENPEPYRVQLGLLVQYEYASGGVMAPPQAAAIPDRNNPNFRYFPDTGLAMSFAIKDYFEKNGGIDVFGYPISLLRYENGNFVQYFQRQRLEWNPNSSSPVKVQTSMVGQMVLDRRYPTNHQWRTRAVNDWCPEVSMASWRPKALGTVITPAAALFALPASPLKLQVYVRFKQTGLTGPQYVDVDVDDPNGKALPGAALSAVVHFSNGTERVFALMSSDANGKSSFQFDIGTQPAGTTTEIFVTANAGSLIGSGRDTFTR